MITLDDFKKTLGEFGDTLTDEQIGWLYEAAYQFADAFFDQWLQKRNKKVATPS